jgi:hypothetical protein
MNEISGERVEPAARVIEPPGLEPRSHSDSGSRRRRQPVRDESEAGESPETPVHQVDRLA